MNSSFQKYAGNKQIEYKKSVYKLINAMLFRKTATRDETNAEKITKFSLKIIEK